MIWRNQTQSWRKQRARRNETVFSKRLLARDGSLHEEPSTVE